MGNAQDSEEVDEKTRLTTPTTSGWSDDTGTIIKTLVVCGNRHQRVLQELTSNHIIETKGEYSTATRL
jgi:hypothetical protein